MPSRTAFVTGATGFLGANLVRELLAQNWKVIAFHRPTSNLWRLKGLEVELKAGSFFDQAGLDQAIPENVDAIFHAAAKVSFWSGDNEQMRKDNVEATKLLLEAALRRKAKRFIHTSSVAVYGYDHSGFDESSPKAGLKSSVGYLRTKAEAEVEVLKAVEKGLDAVILNPGTIVGPFDTEHWGLSMRKVKEGKLAGAPPGGTSFVHSVEAAKAHIRAFEQGKKGQNYILAGTDATYVELFQTMEILLGLRPKAKAVPKAALYLFAGIAQGISLITHKAPFVTPDLLTILTPKCYANSQKAVRELGLQPKPISVMLKDCWESLPKV
ncbi:MAG TPA: SDR family oxidoreductase [bacterium]|jgi:dihydroflavonol-4-reductase|nr:SDR family oxidoreductase [bacterium]